MKKSARRAARLLGVTACVAVLAAAGTWYATRPAPRERVSSLLPASERVRAIQARIEAKNDVADRLLGGELTLLEAAAWFRHLNDSPPANDFRSDWPGASDAEKACRHVIHWARGRVLECLGSSPADLATANLQHELDDLLANDAAELPW